MRLNSKRLTLPGAAGVVAVCVLPLLASEDWAAQRREMAALIASYAPEYRVTDARVLAAMGKVPRHEFVPEPMRRHAYADSPLPIGHGQTISQPLIVAYMTELLELKGKEKVLEIGTGSGYQAAVLAELAREVYTIEIVPELARRAAGDLKRLGYKNVRVRAGDGYQGWPQAAPFDAIMVTCAPEDVPKPLVEQLKLGGKLVIPVGPEGRIQELIVIRKTEKGLEREKKMDVRFVPMTGRARGR